MSDGSETATIKLETKAADDMKALRLALHTLAAILTFLAGCWTTHLYCQHRELPPVIEPRPDPQPKPRPPWRKPAAGDPRPEIR